VFLENVLIKIRLDKFETETLCFPAVRRDRNSRVGTVVLVLTPIQSQHQVHPNWKTNTNQILWSQATTLLTTFWRRFWIPTCASPH